MFFLLFAKNFVILQKLEKNNKKYFHTKSEKYHNLKYPTTCSIIWFNIVVNIG